MLFFKKKIQTPVQNALDPRFISLLNTFKPAAPFTKEKNKYIIRVEGLTKKYFIDRHFKDVLSDVNFTINDGEQVAILGANGAGKTTLLEILSGSVVPTSGKIFYDYDFKYSPQEQIGIQFQDATCPRGLKVFDIISFQNSISLNKIGGVEIAALLKTFHLDHLLNRQASKLSGGQQQRLNVFLAVMSKPKILFLDELSTALDINAQLWMFKHIKDYIDENKITTLISSHNVREILHFAKRVIIIRKGHVVMDTTIESIIKHFKNLEWFLDNYLKLN